MTAPTVRVWRKVQVFQDYKSWNSNFQCWEVRDVSVASWAWQCDRCHEAAKRRNRHYSGFQATIQAATAHSRTHTAERIAAELGQRMDEHRDLAASGGIDDVFDAYHRGAAKGYERSARLIREHLLTKEPQR